MKTMCHYNSENRKAIENERHQKNNGAMVKLIYVYEGMENEIKFLCVLCSHDHSSICFSIIPLC